MNRTARTRLEPGFGQECPGLAGLQRILALFTGTRVGLGKVVGLYRLTQSN
jgi:hypothetical protein